MTNFTTIEYKKAVKMVRNSRLNELCAQINQLSEKWVAKKSKKFTGLIVVGKEALLNGAISIEVDEWEMTVSIFPKDTPKEVASGGWETIDAWYYKTVQNPKELLETLKEAYEKLS